MEKPMIQAIVNVAIPPNIAGRTVLVPIQVVNANTRRAGIRMRLLSITKWGVAPDFATDFQQGERLN